MTDPDAPTQALAFTRLDPDEMQRRADAFLKRVRTRRTVRHFSDEPVPIEVVRTCIEAAAQAPSGAHKQPWTFCLVTDPAKKKAIRQAAEVEERAFYNHRAPKPWLAALQPFATNANKPFLEQAPALIAVFAHPKAPDGEKNYYVQESVGIAVGFLLAALHDAGLATLTHTPVPMKFMAELLERPANERAFLLLPVGFPVDDCQVPAINRKPRREHLVEV